MTDERQAVRVPPPTVCVPPYYPDPENANSRLPWDNSDAAWAWAELLHFQLRCMVELAAFAVARLREDADLAGLLAHLWNLPVRDTQEFVEEYALQSERRAAELGSGSGL
jgi:hypothetical protein